MITNELLLNKWLVQRIPFCFFDCSFSYFCPKRVQVNYELFLAKRIISGGKVTFSGPVIRISVASVAIGLAVMIVSMAIVTGFQQQIRDKITGFGAHIQIARFDANNSFEFSPISTSQPFYPLFNEQNGIRHIQVFATKAGIIQTNEEIQGVVLKGVGKDFDFSFFRDKIVEGNAFVPHVGDPNDSVLVSRSLALKLRVKTGDPLRTFFIIDNQVRGRKFFVSGIYNTGLGEFDNMFLFGDIGHIQKLNGWDPDQVSGFEVLVNNFRELDMVSQAIYETIGYDLDSRTIRELYPQLFDWLDLQDMNVIIILVLMALVSGIAMISALLVLILERTQMIGVLKALGARNTSIQKVFLYKSAYIISKGLILGNLIGIGICLIQKQFGFFRLPEESYFMSVVPIHLSWIHILILNGGILVICMSMLIIPSMIIAKILPVKAIRFD